MRELETKSKLWLVWKLHRDADEFKSGDLGQLGKNIGCVHHVEQRRHGRQGFFFRNFLAAFGCCCVGFRLHNLCILVESESEAMLACSRIEHSDLLIGRIVDQLRGWLLPAGRKFAQQ